MKSIFLVAIFLVGILSYQMGSCEQDPMPNHVKRGIRYGYMPSSYGGGYQMPYYNSATAYSANKYTLMLIGTMVGALWMAITRRN
jgi:hypothetical protein